MYIACMSATLNRTFVTHLQHLEHHNATQMGNKINFFLLLQVLVYLHTAEFNSGLNLKSRIFNTGHLEPMARHWFALRWCQMFDTTKWPLSVVSRSQSNSTTPHMCTPVTVSVCCHNFMDGQPAPLYMYLSALIEVQWTLAYPAATGLDHGWIGEIAGYVNHHANRVYDDLC